MNNLLKQASCCIRQNHQLLHNWTYSFTARMNLVKHEASINPLFFHRQPALIATTNSSPSSPPVNKHLDHILRIAHNIYDKLFSDEIVVSDHGLQQLKNFRHDFLNLFPSSDQKYHSLFHVDEHSESSTSLSEKFARHDVEVPFGILPHFRSARKERQVRRIAAILRRLKHHSAAETVVDVGGGTGLLSELLACDFGISTCVVERNLRLIDKGRRMQSSRATRKLLKRLECQIDVRKEIEAELVRRQQLPQERDETASSSREDDDASAVSRRGGISSVVTKSCSSSSCLLAGIHACGSLSDAVLLSAMSNNNNNKNNNNKISSDDDKNRRIRSFLIVPCCHQRKIVVDEDYYDDHRDDLGARQQQQFVLFSEAAQSERIFFQTNSDDQEKSVSLGQFLSNSKFMRLANLSHELTRDEFAQFTRKYLFQFVLVELPKKNRRLFERLLLLHTENVGAFCASSSSSSSSSFMSYVTSAKGISDLTSHMCSQERDHHNCSYSVSKIHMSARHERINEKIFDSFASFCDHFAQRAAASAVEGNVIRNNNNNNYNNSNFSDFLIHHELNCFCDAIFDDPVLYPIIYNYMLKKATADLLGSIIEGVLFLDRIVLLEEDQRKTGKWQSAVCGSLFSSSTSPRRFGLWGVKKDPVLLLSS